MIGEFRVNRALQRNLDTTKYFLIKDVTIYDDKGTTQIDHLVVSPYGIFVIETKNLKGWIFGSPQQQKWTQSIYKKKFHFQNPVHQNYRHIKALESALTLESKFLLPVIVFVGKCTLKTDMPDNVVRGTGALIRYIQSVDQVQISDSQLPILIERIEGIRLNRGSATDRLHVQNLQNEGRGKKNSRNTIRRVPKAIGILIFTFVILLVLTHLNIPPKQENHTTSPGLPSTNLETVPATLSKLNKHSMGEGNSPTTAINRKQTASLYEIELKSGGRLYAKNLVKTEKTVAYEDGKGLITILSRADIVEIRKLR
ncbi:nuclease-related domain-containing protein [Desulforhopalus sp. 52FAK]